MTDLPGAETTGDDREERIRRRAYEISQQEDAGSPEENQKNLRNAPPEVQSEGTPPPKDNKKPGGDQGDDVTEIG